MKICSKCKESLSLASFNKNRAKKDGLATMCRECWKTYYKDHYYNLGKEKDRLARQREDRRAAFKALIIEAKSVPCVDCGIRYPSYVMDFDHIEDNKLFNISMMSNRSITAVRQEIAKCEVVCSNCHRIRTHSRVTLSAGVT